MKLLLRIRGPRDTEYGDPEPPPTSEIVPVSQQHMMLMSQSLATMPAGDIFTMPCGRGFEVVKKVWHFETMELYILCIERPLEPAKTESNIKLS